MNDSTEYDSPKTRGSRIRQLREALGYSREKFGQKHGIKPSTLHAWEIGRFDGLPEKSAKQLAEAFRKEGLECHTEWLYYGIGKHPLSSATDVPQPLSYEVQVQQELQLFTEHNNNTVDLVLQTNALQPYYWPGDHIAGIRQFASDLVRCLSTPCIVQPLTGETCFGIFKKGNLPDHFILTGTDERILLKETKVVYAAPALWIRRQNQFITPPALANNDHKKK